LCLHEAERAQRRTHLFPPPRPRADFTIEAIFNLTKSDRWFLVQIKEIVDLEEELAGANI
jgi:Carbamoyl-phosphate synthetase large chain, oligomerisation domain